MKRNGFAWIRTILIGVLAFVVILLAIVIISVLVICILLPAFSAFTVWQFLVERVFRFRLRCAGRIMRWDAARQYLKDGGTLIVEIPANGGAVDRLWLLRDRLGKLDPLAPWVAFRQLENQILAEVPTLTAGEEFTRWCRSHLPRLAQSAILISAPRGRTVWQYVQQVPMNTGNVAIVLTPDLTSAVKRSLRRRKLTRSGE